MSFKDYSASPSANTTLGDGTYIGPNMLRNKVRPALQQLAADGKELADIAIPEGSASARAGKFLAWGADGRATASSGTGGGDASLRTDLAATTGAALVAHTRDAVGSVSQSVRVLLDREPIWPEQFDYDSALLSDGHGQAAFDRINARIILAGFGRVQLQPNKEYLVGVQLADALHTDGNTYRRAPKPIIEAENVAALIVEGNGGRIKYRSGQHFGSFESDMTPSGSITVDKTKGAFLASAVRANGCDYVEISNLGIDGNSAGMILGGEFGDTGRQLPHYGVYINQCKAVLARNIRVWDSCLDGILYHRTVASEADEVWPALFENCAAVRCGRNNWTVTGANGLVLINPVGFKAGEAPNAAASGGNISSNPASGIDFEAEGGSLIRDVVIVGPRFRAGALSNTSFVADSGDTERVIVLGGRTAGKLWTSKKYFQFKGLHHRGTIAKMVGGQDDPLANTRFEDGVIDTTPLSPAVRHSEGAFSGPGAGATATSMPRFRRMTLILDAYATNATACDLEDCSIFIRSNTGFEASGSLIMNMTAARLNRIRIYDQVTAPLPANPYYIAGPPQLANDVVIIPSANDKVRFDGPTGYTGTWLFREAKATWDPASIAAAASASTDVTVTGAALGDFASGSFSLALGGLILSAAVSAADTVTVTLFNPTGGAVDLGSGTVRARFTPKQQ